MGSARGRLAGPLARVVLVEGAGLGHGTLPAAVAAAVLACQLCGDAAPVPAGLPEFLEGEGDGLVALGAAGSASLIASAVSLTPSSGLQV
ncbi:hypothetical protein [Streptomyces sp. NPDC058678]|uniref:hypothetical protein n=1 Tax=Streptomyces sp. NPDC058678 TaxID=3346595 RepID=UPI003659619F